MLDCNRMFLHCRNKAKWKIWSEEYPCPVFAVVMFPVSNLWQWTFTPTGICLSISDRKLWTQPAECPSSRRERITQNLNIKKTELILMFKCLMNQWKVNWWVWHHVQFPKRNYVHLSFVLKYNCVVLQLSITYCKFTLLI